MSPPLPSLRLALATVVAAAACAGGSAQQMALPKNSPFMPPAGQVTAAAAASETIEFAGVSSVGKRTDLIFYDKTAKKNHWVGLGETKEGIAAVSYDHRREQAVIKLNGVEKTLILRKGTGGAPGMPGKTVSNPSAPVPSPVVFSAPVAPPAPNPVGGETPPPQESTPPASTAPQTTQQKQETEARMLVSDLLEIGMAQRKAYEEAQRKAADGSTTPTSTPPTEPAKQP